MQVNIIYKLNLKNFKKMKMNKNKHNKQLKVMIIYQLIKVGLDKNQFKIFMKKIDGLILMKILHLKVKKLLKKIKI